MNNFVGALVCALLGGGAVGGLQYMDAQEHEKFKDEVEDAVYDLFDGRWTSDRAAHATDYYAFPLTIYYNASDFDEAEYQAGAAGFWLTFEYVDVAVRHVEIAEESDRLGDVRVTVDATVARLYRGQCKQSADTTYILTLKHLDVGYRIRSEREMAIPLTC